MDNTQAGSLESTVGVIAMRQLVRGHGDCDAGLDISLGETVSSEKKMYLVVANIHIRPMKTKVEKGPV
jgi:hypothetical protein